MTDSLFGEIRTRSVAYVVESTSDRDRLAEILEADRLFAAYALAQLEPDAFPHAHWWTCRTAGGLSLVCLSRAGLGDATFTLGPTAGVDAILSIHAGAFQTFATCKPAHLPALEAAYTLSSTRVMRRMHVTAETFQPVAGDTVLLRSPHVRALNRLYGSEGGPTTYQARHLLEGCYYGVEREGRLVAAAGTHSVSSSSGIAVLGNVFTHPKARGRGYATLATSAVTEELLRTCRDVVLSVDLNNARAIQAYRRLGYVDAGEIVEAAARRRGGGFGTTLRRLIAALRGRRRGVEIVRLPIR